MNTPKTVKSKTLDYQPAERGLSELEDAALNYIKSASCRSFSDAVTATTPVVNAQKALQAYYRALDTARNQLQDIMERSYANWNGPEEAGRT